jgi:hypothetical protein
MNISWNVAEPHVKARGDSVSEFSTECSATTILLLNGFADTISGPAGALVAYVPLVVRGDVIA